MELTCGGNDNAGGCENEGNDEADREVINCKTAVGFSPSLAQHRVREKERHVDANRSRECGDDLVPLKICNGIRPPLGMCSSGGDCRVERWHWLEETGKVGHQSGEDITPGKRAGNGERGYHTKETQHYDANHHFENDFEDLDSLAAGVVKPDNNHGDQKDRALT